MPTITINGTRCDFTPGQMILQAANAHGLKIPQYCYHDGLSIVASCRICLGEVWAPNPRTGQVEPFMGGKLLPTCQTAAVDGMVVYTDSPKAVANQKAVMEYLLINHPLDCPVCDQAGECFLQDYSYEYGRGVSRFDEQKVKQAKKDLGPTIYLYADRCIMCSRCVRFTREVTGTGELMVSGRGNRTEIDVFPGVPLDNPLSANVADLCPVGALLDKDFLFAQRVWHLKESPSIDGLTASGDNITVYHNEGRVYRFKPRPNPAVNKWWITDEVRYSWKHVHAEDRLRSPVVRLPGGPRPCDFTRAYTALAEGLRAAAGRRPALRLALVVSPMLTAEEAYLLALFARAADPKAGLYVGPVPVSGEDRVYPKGATRDDPRAFVQHAEKAPNARGVRRVLSAVGGSAPGDWARFSADLRAGAFGALVLTGNYPSRWADDELVALVSGAGTPARTGPFTIVIDTLSSPLADAADVLLPGATWLEKAGTFENAAGLLQSFPAAIPVLDGARAEGQIALELAASLAEPTPGTPSERAGRFDAARTRADMAARGGDLAPFASLVEPSATAPVRSDMQVVEL